MSKSICDATAFSRRATVIDWTILTAVLCLTAGCNAVQVNDLRFAGIKGLDPAQVIPPELTGWNPESNLVKFTFVTKTNVRDVARELGLHLHVDAYFCANRAHGIAKMQILFDRDGAITENPQPSSSANEAELWFYAAEKSPVRKDIETGRLSIPPYDLVQQPRDVCVQLHGRNMALEGFSSNIVKIKTEELTRMLARDQ